MMQDSPYPEVRGLMQPGDVIAFGGKGHVSNLIKWATRGPVSHIGIIFQSKAIYTLQEDRYVNDIMESTSLGGKKGVTRTRLSVRLQESDGPVWWLPLSSRIRERLNLRSYFDFLFAQEGKPYDFFQAARSGIDTFDGVPFLNYLTENKHDAEKYFCSELVVDALAAAGAIPRGINASEVTPIDLCRLDIFAGGYTQMHGEPEEIPGFGSVPVDVWARAA